MGKKKNKKFEYSDVDSSSVNVQEEFPVQYPPKFERDYVSSIDDETLHNITKSLIDSIGKVNRLGLNPYPWEVELCYLQQETQVRSTRKAAHTEWLKTKVVDENA